MRDKSLSVLARLHTEHPWRMAGFVLLLSLVFLLLAMKLTVSMRVKDLLPSGDPKVDQLNIIIDEFSTSTSLMIVVQGEESLIKDFADELAPVIPKLKYSDKNGEINEKIDELETKLEAIGEDGDSVAEKASIQSRIENLETEIDRPLFQRVDYKMETEFIRSHGLMLIESEDLENVKAIYSDPDLPRLIGNINDMMEMEYIGQEESLSSREEEDGAVEFLNGIQHLVTELMIPLRGDTLSRPRTEAVADRLLYGEPYFLSYDRTTLIMNAIPNFTIMDRDLLVVGTEAVQREVDRLLNRYPGVEAGLSGDIAREHDEQLASQRSIQYTSVIAFVAILIMLVISFRMLIAPVFAGINLFICLIWAMGAAYLAVRELNMMTATLSVVLLGLGIDFSIHMISGFTEWRSKGYSIYDSLESTFLKSGRGIITGGLTTSFAFLALLVSRSKGMKEMGIVTGVGLISVMIGTFLILPLMLVFRERFIERRRSRKGEAKDGLKRDLSFASLGRTGKWLSEHFYLTVSITIAVSVLLVWSASRIKYDKNYLNMEPKGLTSIALMDTVKSKFDLGMEYSLCLADGVDESRRLAEAYRDLGSVARTDDISLYIPSPEEQELRRPHIEEILYAMKYSLPSKRISSDDINILFEEIGRLEMNVMEMQDIAYLGGKDKVDNKCAEIVGDPSDPESVNLLEGLINALDSIETPGTSALSRFQEDFSAYYRERVLEMCDTTEIQLSDLPVSVLDRYSNPQRDRFLITIYPSGMLYSDTDILELFVNDMDSVSEKTTGNPIVAVSWMRIAAEDGRKAIGLTLIIVFLLLWFDFRKPLYALLAMIPLLLGTLWMVGIMNLSGLMLNFMTMMGLPLIIGIGIDDGVHVIHRWQAEGRGRIFTVFSNTGKAILLTSLTTMLAFGSMVFSVFPAWAWFGGSLFIGVGACFVTTVFVLAGVLGWIEKSKSNENVLNNTEE